MTIPSTRSLIALTAVAMLSACSRESAHPSEPTASGQDVSVQVSPADAQTTPGGTVTFAAAVTGTIETGVVWDVVESGGGAVDAGGVYTAPASGGTFHVRATSKADPARLATATVTVSAAAPAPGPTPAPTPTPTPTPTPAPAAVAVTVSPASANVLACQTQRLTASVTGASDAAVTWTVQEGTAGGAVTATGVYTAPASGGTYHVIATSHADPTKTAVATLTVAEKVLSVAVAPATTTVQTSGTQQFTATVTTTCGAFTSTQTIN